MTTIDDLVDTLNSHPRGQSLLINLHRTIEKNWVSPDKIKAACNDFLLALAAGTSALPSTTELVDRLGDTFVAKGLWLDAPEPILKRHLPKNQRVLTRVTSYSGFFYSVLGRKNGAPPLSNMPEPSHTNEINASKVKKVQKSINSGKWKDWISGNNIRFNPQCTWLAPLPELVKKIDAKTVSAADFHRDVIGLAHFHKGRHLIRLDFDLNKWTNADSNSPRRPHGAGNGGSRFRLDYDGDECTCQWGRTVDLTQVANKSPGTLNGIPEMLMASFSTPKQAISATYIGEVRNDPECEDDYFISRLRKTDTMSEITTHIKKALA